MAWERPERAKDEGGAVWIDGLIGIRKEQREYREGMYIKYTKKKVKEMKEILR